MAQFKVGDKAPAFTLLDQSGDTIKVLVYFYRRASENV
jgi:peroxiredoxin